MVKYKHIFTLLITKAFALYKTGAEDFVALVIHSLVLTFLQPFLKFKLKLKFLLNWCSTSVASVLLVIKKTMDLLQKKYLFSSFLQILHILNMLDDIMMTLPTTTHGIIIIRVNILRSLTNKSR